MDSITYILKNISLPGGGEIQLQEKIVKSFIFIEDLESMYLIGQLEIIDIDATLEVLELTGNEKLEVEIKDGDISKILQFDIFNIKNVPVPNSRMNIYQFSLVEEGFDKLTNRKYSKSYKQELVSDILKDILKNQLKQEDCEIEVTTNKIDFIIPYWNPLMSIRYLLKVAKGSKSSLGSGLIFYTSMEDTNSSAPKKKIVSLESIISEKSNQDSKEIYYQKKYDVSPYYKNLVVDFKNLSLSSKKEARKGFSGKTYIGVDFHNDKKLVTQSKTLDDFIKQSTFLGTNINIKNTDNDKYSEVAFKGYLDTNLMEIEEDYWFRMGVESLNVREILCGGFLDRWAGQIIYIDEGSDLTTKVTDKHIQLEGNWLIKKITHIVESDNNYVQKILLVKDGYNKISNTSDFKTITKKNI